MGQRRLFYGWVVLAVSAAITCLGMGALFSLGVFLKPIEDSTGWSRSAISVVALLAMGTGSLPLYAIVTREYFSEKIMGSAYGAVFLVSTIGMGLGSFAGGAIYDRLGSWAWLYLGSDGVGLAAVLPALTFRRPRPAGHAATSVPVMA